MSTADTIAALGSASGSSPAGLIRLSGPDAARIGGALLEPADRRPKRPKPFTVRGAFEARLLPPLPPLPVLALLLPGPRSFTGEDTLEVEAPGHPALLRRILREAEKRGAREAEPGEFSHLAFEAGKVSLLQAEGTAALIAAENDAQLAAANRLRRGTLAAEVLEQRDRLVHLLGLVEAGIDFTDQEDVVPIAPPELDQKLLKLIGALDGLASAPAAAPRTLPRVALAGPPSAGKSSLFNALLGRERAVVDAAPHTTRDALEEELELPGGPRVLLVDVPGGEVPKADLLLWFGDAAPPAGVPHLRIHAKSDLEPEAPGRLATSAHTRAGLPALLAAIEAAAATPRAPVPLARHLTQLRLASADLTAARAFVDRDAESLEHPEFIADALTSAVGHLAGLTGELTPDDLIASVFATFCVGK